MRVASSDSCDDEAIDDEALAWFVRLNDPAATAGDYARFERWRARDPRHARAYRQACELWLQLEAPARRLADHTGPRRRRRPVRWAAAACGVLALMVAGALWRDPGLIDRARADIATAPGVSRSVRLADGSRVFTDFDTAIDVDVSGPTRRLRLLRGRVWLDVAKDGRAFIIDSGRARVRVVGTQLAVARQANRVRVTVERGEVAVAGSDSASPARHLSAGQQVAVENGRPGAVQAVDADIALAWHRGLVLFDRAHVDAVAAQLQRALPGRVVYDDAALADLVLSGSFAADRPQALIDTLEHSYGIEVSRFGASVIWLHR